MATKAKTSETVPQPFQTSGTVVRPVLKASKQAKAALGRVHAERRRLIEAQARERALVEAREVEDHLDAVAAQAQARGEEVARQGKGPVHIARDGLAWALRKGTLDPVHVRAGERFRDDFEVCQGGGLGSCLEKSGGRGQFSPHTSGPTVEMMAARGRVEAALASLGTPMLHGYVVMVAGEGAMLTDARIGGPKGAGDHVLPCRIAFDLLARHYGMIR